MIEIHMKSSMFMLIFHDFFYLSYKKKHRYSIIVFGQSSISNILFSLKEAINMHEDYVKTRKRNLKWTHQSSNKKSSTN